MTFEINPFNIGTAKANNVYRTDDAATLERPREVSRVDYSRAKSLDNSGKGITLERTTDSNTFGIEDFTSNRMALIQKHLPDKIAEKASDEEFFALAANYGYKPEYITPETIERMAFNPYFA